LIGHDNSVSCIDISTSNGFIASGSIDCSCICYSLDGKYIRSLRHKAPISLVKIASNGSVVTYCQDLSQLYIFDINGNLEITLPISNCSHILVTKNSKLIVTAAGTVITIRDFQNKLEILQQFDTSDSNTPHQINAMQFISSQDEEVYLIASGSSGSINIFPIKS